MSAGRVDVDGIRRDPDLVRIKAEIDDLVAALRSEVEPRGMRVIDRAKVASLERRRSELRDRVALLETQYVHPASFEA